MEMLLKHVSDYEVVLETEITKEETLESIVPDISPDVAAVVFTGGFATVREKEIRENEVSISGSVRVTALCRPETATEATGGGALCRLECAIPFSHTFSGGANRNGGRVMARAWVERTSARVLNPRKVMLTVTLGIAVTAWQPRERSLCIGLMSEAFKLAIESGRKAWLAGLGRVLEKEAEASSPLTGFLEE